MTMAHLPSFLLDHLGHIGYSALLTGNDDGISYY